MWLHQVEVVETSSYVHADGGNVGVDNGSPFQHCSEAGCHELGENDRLSFQRCSDELYQVWMTQTSGHVHLTIN